MNIIKFGEHNVVFGLHWVRLQGNKLTSEIVEALAERNSSIGITRKISTDYDQRVQIGIADDKSAKGAYSAASIVCNNSGSLLFVEKLNDEQYWLAAVAENEVLPGGDIVGNGDLISSKIQEWLEEFGTSVSEVKLIASPAACEDLEINSESVMTFEDFVFSNEHLFNSSNKVSNVKVMPKPLTMVILVIAILFGGYSFLSPNGSPVSSIVEVLPGETPFQAIERVNLPLGPSEDDLLAAALMEELKWLREDFEQLSPNKVINAVLNVTSKLPKFKGGWEAVDAKYDVNRDKDTIRVEWKRGRLGTASTLLNGLDIDGREFTKGGITAFTYHKLEKKRKRKIGRDVLYYIANTKYGIDNLRDDFQSLSDVNWSIDKAITTSRPVKIEGIKNKKLQLERQLKQPFEKFRVSDTNTTTVYKLVKDLEKADSVIISRVEIGLNSTKWKVTGRIYEN